MDRSKKPSRSAKIRVAIDLPEADDATREALFRSSISAARLSAVRYLAFLKKLPEASIEMLRQRPLSTGAPFELRASRRGSRR